MNAPAQAAIREAASLIVLRDAAGGGVEVLMMRRPEKSGDFRSAAWVFPGGVVDAGDALPQACCHGLDEAEAAQRLGEGQSPLRHFVAAVRECFEEVGLLYAVGVDGRRIQPEPEVAFWRGELHAGRTRLADLLQQRSWRLDLAEVAFFAHWLTPPTRPKRFDTRFFVMCAPAGQEPAADDKESLELRWVRPAAAAAEDSGMHMLRVTRHLLSLLEPFASAADGYTQARAKRGVVRVAPQTHDGAAPAAG